jgi:hypothetical protein
MDKCPEVELGVPQYPPEKKWDDKNIYGKKKMIAHGPSNKQYASKSWQVLIFKVFDLRVWHSSPRIPFWPRQYMQSKYAWEFLQIKTASVRYTKDKWVIWEPLWG